MNSTEVLSRITQVIRAAFERPHLVITRDSTALDVDGWDSLAHTVLILQVEKEFAIKLPREQIFGLRNVGELVDLVLKTTGT